LILPLDFRPQDFIQFAEAFEFLSIKICCVHSLQSCPKKIFILCNPLHKTTRDR
jgi:hypothetical protein